MQPIAEIESTPEYVAAQKANAALQKRTEDIRRRKAERDAILGQHAAMAAELQRLKEKRARGIAEIEGLDRLTASKIAAVHSAFGDPYVRPGLASSTAREALDGTAIIGHLRSVLAELDATIAAKAKELAAYTETHQIL